MLTVSGVTHAGHIRKMNEDCWLGESDLGLFVVADGMGGHNAGEIASRLAVDAISGFLVRTNDNDDVTWPYGIDPNLSFNGNRLLTALKLANRRVFKFGESRDDYTGLGTTAVVALIDHQRLVFAGVGDSRIYSYAGGQLRQLTSDDSWVAQVMANEPTIDRATLQHHPMRHVLTNVIGAREGIDISIHERSLENGEVLLLCSDGLHAALDHPTIEAILSASARPDEISDRLLQAVLEGPAKDNVTIVVVRHTA